MNTSGLDIVVSGMIAADPYQGGAAWAVLQYVLGFRRLGHRVWLVEPLPEASLLPTGAPLECSTNAAYFRETVRAFGLDASAALLLAGSETTVGLTHAELRSIAGRADVLINISGMLTDPALVDPIPVRVYLDLDPAFNQLWHSQGIDMRFAGHSHFVTVGQAIGTPDCTVPTCGQSWIATVPPIVMSHWPVAVTAPAYGFTTVANWRAYGSIDHEGVFHGQKCHALRPFVALPTRTSEAFELALNIHEDERQDLVSLAQNGWRLIDPLHATSTPERYRAFIQSSKAEFGIAKSGYVVSRCGWFSDRSACYLASGRPVVAQDTGFSRMLPTGEGLFAFQTDEDVLASVDALQREYSRHAHAARALAVKHFDSDIVLTRLLQSVGAAA